MKSFESYIEETSEIGEAEEVKHSLVYVSGLPKAKPAEIVIFESGEIGEVFSVDEEQLEVLLLTKATVQVGTKACRTNESFTIPVGESLLGKIISPMALPLSGSAIRSPKEKRYTDVQPPGLSSRKNVSDIFETGSSIVDLLVPLGKGQRELVVGDRKTGKTQLLLQIALNQLQSDTICIYAAIAKRRVEKNQLWKFFKDNKAENNLIMVVSHSSDPPGLIFQTPYAAMTIAEYFRDQGKDVLLILDDMSTHAKFYREISLLANRFPGRSAYPGDIFYVHAKLMERAGNFKTGSITCIPVAETMLGDISGYIQTNLMSMTDGHIYFDTDLYNEGRRPAVNPFLSVTRVGLQTQSELVRDVSRQVSAFLSHTKKLKQFMHFGAELSDKIRQTIALGARLNSFFEQRHTETVALNATVFITAALWSGFWKDSKTADMKAEQRKIASVYASDDVYKKKIDNLIVSSKSLEDLSNSIAADPTLLGKEDD